MAKKLMLMDGHSILNRAFYGMPDLTNAEGKHTGAVYGFLTMMLRFLKEEMPDYFVVAFDMHAPTFRHAIYKEYKGTRKPMPEELRSQVPLMHDVLQAMGVCVMEKEGLEADDILGTLAKTAAKEGMEVALISGDRDLLQIADETIKIRIPKTKMGKTEVEDYYAKDVLETYKVTPEGFIDLKALMGDTADNIPGVPKVGEKTAQELMVTYGSLSAIYEHVEEITKKAIRESLIANKELADLSKVLATINIQAEIPFDLEKMSLGNIFTKEAYDIFVELSFKNLLSNFETEGAAAKKADPKETFQVLSSVKEMDAFLKVAEAFGKVGIYAFASDQEGLVVALSTEEKTAALIAWNEDARKLAAHLRNALEQKKIMFCTYDVKQLYKALSLPDASSSLYSGQVEDVHILAYLLDPTRSEIEITDIARDYLQLVFPSLKDSLGKMDMNMALVMQGEDILHFACYSAYTAVATTASLLEKVGKQGMGELYRQTEMPLSFVLYRMEEEGILTEKKVLEEISEELGKRIQELEEKIYEAADCTFNINSPKQLGELLFDKMGLPGGKKTKTGYSTSAEVLEELAADVPFVQDILQYRMMTKLRSTYAEGLKDFIGADGRIHSHFNQTVTATGRISSTEPNLQNIPMRAEEGRLLRKAFVAKEGYTFCDADYSQIELRILAALSEDEHLKNAFINGQDIHRSTASLVFHTPFDEVTDLQRRNAKAVNFGIVYGISAFGLAKDLKISREEAKGYIASYFETYPGIHAFLENAKTKAKEKGYSETYFGRRRPIPELKNSNFAMRSFGERVAMNAPIQGTAADIMKMATVKVYDRLLQDGYEARMVLQVHDELVVETPEEEKERVLTLLSEEMENAAALSVQLLAEAHSGKDLYEAK